MKNKKNSIILLSVILLNISCQNNSFDNRKNNNYSKEFKQFISKFKMLELPFTANTSCYIPDSALCIPLEMDNDSIFIEYSGPAITIGILPDTSIFYAIIYCTAASCYMPNLAVYTKDGSLICKTQISIGCGAGEGYTCNETLVVKSSKNISIKNIQEYFEVDSIGREIVSTKTSIISIHNYSINNTGIISVEKSQNTTR